MSGAKLTVDVARFEREIKARLALEDRERRAIAAQLAPELKGRLADGTPVRTGETARAWEVFGIESDKRPGITWIKMRNKAPGAIWGIYAGNTVKAHVRKGRKGPVTVRGYRRINTKPVSSRRRFVIVEQTRAATEAYERMRSTRVFDAP